MAVTPVERQQELGADRRLPWRNDPLAQMETEAGQIPLDSGLQPSPIPGVVEDPAIAGSTPQVRTSGDVQTVSSTEESPAIEPTKVAGRRALPPGYEMPGQETERPRTGTPLDFAPLGEIYKLRVKAEKAMRERTGDPSPHVSAMNSRRLYQGLLDGTVTEEQINKEYLKPLTDPETGISKADHDWLIKKINEPEGLPLRQREKEVIEAAKHMLKSSLESLMSDEGSYDESGAKLDVFRNDLQKKIEDKRKTGQDWRTLFDPNSDEYVLNPQHMQTYQRSLQDILKDKYRTTKPPSTAPSAASPGIQPRLPQETLQQWRDRTGYGKIKTDQTLPQVPMSR